MKIHWEAELQALAHLRKKQGVHLNKPSLILLIGLVLFVGLVIKFGIENTMAAFAVVGFLAFNIVSNKRFKFGSQWTRSGQQIDANLRILEEKILQSVVQSASPSLHFKMAAPGISQQFRSSDLIRQKIDYIEQARCVTGVNNGIAFCATYINTGRYESYQDSEGRTQQTRKDVYQGLFVIADFPEAKTGWVNLHSDNLEKLGWMADELRHVSDSNYVRMENVDFETHFNVRASSPVDAHLTLNSDTMERLTTFGRQHGRLSLAMALKDQTVVMLLPMTTNPFLIRDNPSLWTGELSSLQDTASFIADFVKALATSQITISKAAS